MGKQIVYRTLTNALLKLSNVSIGKLLVRPVLRTRASTTRLLAVHVVQFRVVVLGHNAVLAVNANSTTGTSKLLTGPGPLVNLGGQQDTTTRHCETLVGRQVITHPVPVVPILMVTTDSENAQVIDTGSLVNLIEKQLPVSLVSPQSEVTDDDYMVNLVLARLVNLRDNVTEISMTISLYQNS